MLRHRNEYLSEGTMPGFEGATAWINSAPLTADDGQGRVVLVSFGTYTCINWIRTLPYVRAWADRYGPEGLLVVGVQTPEFSFEKEHDGVRSALNRLDVRYPVAVDNDYVVWRAFDNHYWPALYFVDAEGEIRHHRFGEGDYLESERVLQMLLAEAGVRVDGEWSRPVPQAVEQAADWDDLGSPENYVGYGRTEGFASPGGVVRDERHAYRRPASLQLIEWALASEWRIGMVAAVLEEPGGSVSYRFHARDLHLVMRTEPLDAAVRYRVRLDGQPPGPAQGLDVDADGDGVIDGPRLYQLIRQPGPIVDRTFEIEFLDRGVEVFVFTFG